MDSYKVETLIPLSLETSAILHPSRYKERTVLSNHARWSAIIRASSLRIASERS